MKDVFNLHIYKYISFKTIVKSELTKSNCVNRSQTAYFS